MTALTRLPGRAELALLALGSILTVLFAGALTRPAGEQAVLALVGLTIFVAVAAGFVFAPHIFVALTIVYFVTMPTLEVFLSAELGASKDVISLTALLAAGVLAVRRRVARVEGRLETGVLVVLALHVGLYLVNVGGAISGETGHGAPWFHGSRLIGEPLAMFVVGASLPDPRRTLRWGVAALLAACCVNAFFGALQQQLNVGGLLALGYTYGEQVRQISGHVRSFGTLEEPFAYAGLLLFGIATTLLWFRRSVWRTLAFLLLAAGLYFSYVRTAAVIVVALVATAALRRGYGRYALLLAVAVLAVSAAFFLSASQQTESRSVRVNPSLYLTLNGRTNIWKSTLRSPGQWIFGRGVGATGTASQRATRGLTQIGQTKTRGGSVVDSSYFATIADVGIFGLALLLAFYARVLMSLARSARADDRAAWLGIGLVVVVLLDALTRESFTGFPTAYVGLLLVGTAYAAAVARRRLSAASPR